MPLIYGTVLVIISEIGSSNVFRRTFYMKKFGFLALTLLLTLATSLGCSKDKDSKVAAVPNSNCQNPNQSQQYGQYGQYGGQYGQYNPYQANQYSCWTPGMANGVQPFQVPGGCQGYPGYQPTLYQGYGMGCVPQQYMGNNPYYGNNAYYTNYFQMGSVSQYAVACDIYYPQSCGNGQVCRDVGMGRLGICGY